MRGVRLGERRGHSIPLGVGGGSFEVRRIPAIPRGALMSLASERLQGNWLLDGAGTDGRGARLVARTLFREMQRSGFTRGQVLAVADELLGCLCAAAASAKEATKPGDPGEPDGTAE